jgi:hypothetical protein
MKITQKQYRDELWRRMKLEHQSSSFRLEEKDRYLFIITKVFDNDVDGDKKYKGCWIATLKSIYNRAHRDYKDNKDEMDEYLRYNQTYGLFEDELFTQEKKRQMTLEKLGI